MEQILEKATPGLRRFSYNIDFGPMDAYGADEVLAREVEAFYFRLNKKQKNLNSLIADLRKKIAQYPHALPLKNYLYCAYMLSNQDQKAEEFNDSILAEYPDYLFAIVNKAAIYIMKRQFEKVPEVLGNLLQLGALMPEREKFHITEFLAYEKMVLLYACGIGNEELAENRYELMKKMGPDFKDTQEAFEALGKLRIKRGFEKMAESQKRSAGYNQVPDDYLTLAQTDREPSFYHADIKQLYLFSSEPDTAVFKALLALPRETLIKDLQEVIYDSIRRFTWYVEGMDDDEQQQTWFPLHAMVLLAELKAQESLTTLLEVLRQGENYLDFWFGDILTDSLWQIYYRLFDKEQYLLFLQEPRIYTFAKSAVSDAFFKKAKIELSRPETISIYKSILQYTIDNSDNSDLTSSNFTSGVVGDICVLQLTELLPLVKTCYNLNTVDSWICGSYQSVEKDTRTRTDRHIYECELSKGFEAFYTDLNRTFGENKENLGEEDSRLDFYEDVEGEVSLPQLKPAHSTEQLAEALIAKKPLAGRNDPCPCGSGKKYKKCCLDNS